MSQDQYFFYCYFCKFFSLTICITNDEHDRPNSDDLSSTVVSCLPILSSPACAITTAPNSPDLRNQRRSRPPPTAPINLRNQQRSSLSPPCRCRLLLCTSLVSHGTPPSCSNPKKEGCHEDRNGSLHILLLFDVIPYLFDRNGKQELSQM